MKFSLVNLSTIFVFLLMNPMTVSSGIWNSKTSPTTSNDSISINASISSSPTPSQIAVPIVQNETPIAVSSGSTQPGLSPEDWRNWPVIPKFSPETMIILAALHENPDIDLHTFSRVGDCQFTSETFLAPYAKGIYTIPEGYEETVHYYKESMVRDSVTAENGLGVNSVLNPLFAAGAGYTQCKPAETPLDCELRTRKPAVVLVAMGTNWKPNAEITFEENLRIVVDKIIATGALPILATKADNIEEDWKLNLAIARVAYDYHLPLVNLWLAVQGLSDHGLHPPRNQYLTGSGCMTQNYIWLKTLELVRIELAD